jgi:ribose transport system ATP-binding protein
LQTRPILSMHNIVKTYGETRALRGVDLDLFPGKITALLGINGSGKSTLIKILSGAVEPDRGCGELTLRGVTRSLPVGRAHIQEQGIQFVHQDLGLWPSLTVRENFLAVRKYTGRTWYTNARSQDRRVSAALKRFDIDVDPSQVVASLDMVDRSLLSIARAVSAIDDANADPSEPGALILDEPTVYLGLDKRRELYDTLLRLRGRGMAVLLVSHNLQDVRSVADGIAIMRNGLVVERGSASDFDDARVLDLLAGDVAGSQAERDRVALSAAKPDVIDGKTPRDFGSQGEEVTRIRSARAATLTSDGLDLTLRTGEILGVTGLAGSGHDRIPYLLYGALSGGAGGTVEFRNGSSLRLGELTPARALAHGFALVPRNRQEEGCIPSATVTENMTIHRAARHRGGIAISRKRLRQSVKGALDEFDVVYPDCSAEFDSLSGGNQQRALLAKWLADERTRLLLVDEPTQGVDPLARRKIIEAIRAAAQAGIAVLVASEDYEQLEELCDRVLVFRNGKPAADLTAGELNQRRMTYASLSEVQGGGNSDEFG